MKKVFKMLELIGYWFGYPSYTSGLTNTGNLITVKGKQSEFKNNNNVKLKENWTICREIIIKKQTSLPLFLLVLKIKFYKRNRTI